MFLLFFPHGIERGIVIPKSAVINSKGNNFVIVKKENRYILTPITITKKVDEKFIVSSGVSEGDEIVITGINLLEREFFGGEK